MVDNASRGSNAEREALLFGRYRVLEEWGRTPTGTLYAAEDVKLGDLPITLQRLPRWITQDVEARTALKDAVSRAHELAHANLVTPRHVEEGEPGVYLVMDQIRGTTLADHLLRTGPLDGPRMLAILQPIAAALDFAHAEGVFHGDVEPSHIVIENGDEAHLMDVGVAHEVTQASVRMTGRFPRDTLCYRAPEQLEGAVPAPPQDVYALAATAYECLSGRPPLGREATPAHVALAVPAPLVGSPEELSRAILLGVSKDPARRPGTCSALLGERVRPRPTLRPSPRRTDRPRQERPQGERSRSGPDRLAVLAARWRKVRRRALLGVSILALLCLLIPICRREGRKRPVSPLSLLLSLGATAEIDTPPNGACLATDAVAVTGRASGGIELVHVNRTPAPVVGERFEANLPATTEGELSILVTTPSGEVLAERQIQIDRTPPEIVLHAPATNPYECRASSVVFRGEIVDRNPTTEIRVGEETVALHDERHFTHEVPYQKGESPDVEIVARDAAGNEGRHVVRIRPPGTMTKSALEDALKWLAAHQSPNGGWEAAGFHKWCDGAVAPEGKRPRGRGRAIYDPGVTGLALCTFLGAGYTNRGRHPFAKTVTRGLRYLRYVQDAEGCFGPRTSQHYMYNHATASLAMVEAYGLTQSPVFKASAQKCLDFICKARNPYFAWRYGVKPGDNDTAVTAWMMMALNSAKLFNDDAVERGKPPPLDIDVEAFAGIQAWIDKMTDPDSGRTGYIRRGGPPDRPRAWLERFSSDRSEATTGVGLLARIFLGEDPSFSEIIKKGSDLCARRPPTWDPDDGSIDMYYWHFATFAMFQVGGRDWKIWNENLKKALSDSQRQDTTYCLYKGSWDPIGPWGPDGGRVYSTAMLGMCLEVYYRYARVFEDR